MTRCVVDVETLQALLKSSGFPADLPPVVAAGVSEGLEMSPTKQAVPIVVGISGMGDDAVGVQQLLDPKNMLELVNQLLAGLGEGSAFKLVGDLPETVEASMTFSSVEVNGVKREGERLKANCVFPGDAAQAVPAALILESDSPLLKQALSALQLSLLANKLTALASESDWTALPAPLLAACSEYAIKQRASQVVETLSADQVVVGAYRDVYREFGADDSDTAAGAVIPVTGKARLRENLAISKANARAVFNSLHGDCLSGVERASIGGFFPETQALALDPDVFDKHVRGCLKDDNKAQQVLAAVYRVAMREFFAGLVLSSSRFNFAMLQDIDRITTALSQVLGDAGFLRDQDSPISHEFTAAKGGGVLRTQAITFKVKSGVDWLPLTVQADVDFPQTGEPKLDGMRVEQGFSDVVDALFAKQCAALEEICQPAGAARPDQVRVQPQPVDEASAGGGFWCCCKRAMGAGVRSSGDGASKRSTLAALPTAGNRM